MKVTLLPSAVAASATIPSQYLTTFLINDRIAVDAGSLGLHGTPLEQSAVRHIFLSHSHIDHWASLPSFLVNVAGLGDTPPTIYASEVVQDCLRRDVFNGRVWPNFLQMKYDGQPFVTMTTIADGEPVDVEGLRITPVAVDHSVPTLGFVIEEPNAAVVIASDTSATTRIWQLADRAPNLKAVFLEATLPNNLAALANVTGHLTADGFVAEMKKLSRPVPFFAVHLSARNRDRVLAELLAHRLPNVEIAQFGRVYEF